MARLDDEAPGLRLPGGWTFAATLAHLALWYRCMLARWDWYEQHGGLDDLPDSLANMVNAAAQAEWLALPH